MKYHAGEVWVQSQAGVTEEADRLAAHIGDEMYPRAVEFAGQRLWAIATTQAPDGQVWLSFLAGNSGFIQSSDRRSVELSPVAIATPPFWQHLAIGSNVGLLAMDLAHRQRLRINGTVDDVVRTRQVRLTTHQVYFNCPKYIQQRLLQEPHWRSPQRPVLGESLTEAQVRWISQADTFFLGTVHPDAGFDSSHRGGEPGFVEVLSAQVLRFQDYVGNNMFNSLGNIAAEPHVGLLFLDFEQGEILQISGTAQLHWDAPDSDDSVLTARWIEVTINAIQQVSGVCPYQWTLQDFSSYNPSQKNSFSSR